MYFWYLLQEEVPNIEWWEEDERQIVLNEILLICISAKFYE